VAEEALGAVGAMILAQVRTGCAGLLGLGLEAGNGGVEEFGDVHWIGSFLRRGEGELRKLRNSFFHFGVGPPSKVGDAIVGFVPIQMTDTGFVLWIRDEGFGHEPVDPAGYNPLVLDRYGNHQIPVFEFGAFAESRLLEE